MTDTKKIRTLRYIESRRIHMLFASILLFIFGPPFVGPKEEWVELYVKFSFVLIVISCFLIIRKHSIAMYISLVTFLLIVIDNFFEHEVLNYLSQIGLTILIFHAFSLVLKEAMSLSGNTENMILVSITGYLIIGLVGGLIVAGLAHFNPDSYYHSTGLELKLFNYVYYSFVTMTTLGYGDIVPITEKSQSLAMMLVIAGQLFLSIIIGMNIAKFMQRKQ